MTVYQKLCDMWPEERARALYLPQGIARELSFLNIEEMADCDALCPVRMQGVGHGACNTHMLKASDEHVCRRCRLDYLSERV